jgi:hypothetical protein
MPANNTLLPTLGDTAPTQMTFELDERHSQLVILQNAFRGVLSCAELRDADPPMLDTLDALTERFKDLLER